MITQLKALHKIKSMKRDNALTALQVKRGQQREAEAALEKAREIVRESARTLPERKDAVYDKVMGTVVDPGRLDELRGEIIQLEQDHEKLKDAENRAAHINQRLIGEVEQAKEFFRNAERVQEKYTILRDDVQSALTAEAEYKEDAEIEDLFSRPRKKVA